MADDVIFEKEDRVKVTSGKLKGKKGYVRYVGTVASKDDMIFVGVELDEPNGKHDGKVKGKRYFKCRDKHGYMAPHETFELFGKSKKKLLNRKPKLKPSKSSNKSSKSTKNTKSKLLNKSTSSPPFSTKDSASKIKGKKKKKKKDVLNDSKKDLLSVKMPTLHGDNISPSKSPTPIITQITYCDISTQTDMRRLHIVNDDNDIASVSKEVAEAHANMIESLRNQISKLNTEILQLKGNNLKLENEIMNKNDLIEILTIEKESQNEEILDLKQEINENKILVENLELDIDELKDDQNNIRLSIVEELEYGSKNINDILQQNAELKATMDILKKNALSEITCKNSDILQLAMKCKGIPSLKKHISELESQLELKSNIENECIEFKRELDLRSNTDSIIEILSTKNVELEYEIKRLNEVNKHFENMDNIFNEIEKENEQYIFDLNEELKCKELIIIELNTKLNKLNKELRHSQNTVFQFKDHIHKLEETKRKINLSFNNNKKGNKDLKLEKEILLRCNLELLERINNIKKELIKYSNIASHGISNSIENEILISHIPHTIKCDYGSIKCLGFLGRILFKNKFCFEILNSFYIQGDNKVGNEIIRENDIKDIYKVIELCPILIKQYRFINCIYLGLLDIGCHESEIDKFNDAINEWSQLLEIENKYNKLLLCISNNNIRSGNISISDIFKCNDLFRQYINKHFAIFSPEIKHREKEIIDKWELYIQLQSIKYNLYNMKLKTNEINDIIISENENENENQRICIVGVLTKIEELQIIIMEIVQRSLKFCKPIECNIFNNNNQTLPIKTIKKLQDENYIGIQFNFIDNFSILMRSLITKQNLLIENLHKTFQQTELTHFDRIGKINRLLDEQSEVSQNGIVCGLEKLYKHIKSLPYQLEQLIPDENIILKPPNNDSININIVPTVWNKKASIIREELGEADIIRDALESAQAEIKSKQKELMLEKSNTGQIKSRLEVVKLELAKQRTINRDLIHYELEAKDSETKLIKYIDKNKLLKNQNNKLMKTKTELENQLNSYQNTLKSMKLKSSKRKIKNLHDDNTIGIGIGIGHDDKIGHHKRGHSLTNMHSIHHSLSHKPLNGKLTGHLSLGDGSNSFDLMDTNGEQNNQFVISQLHKELDLNKKYNKLLQKTVNSLRHNYNIYNLHKQYIQMKKDLKPLPNFNSINQMQYKKYCQKKKLLIDKKKQKNLLIEKERNKLLSQPVKSKSKEKEKDQNINDNDNDDSKMEINDILSSYKQKEIKQNRYKNIQKSLTNLDKQFGEIYSFPNIIDLTNENINYKQQIIARNMKLRDIKLKCSKLTKEYKEIQSNFEHNNNIHHNSSHDNDITPTDNNVSILGRIDIEGLKNTNYQINKTKVCLNRNNVIKLQNYLNVLC